VTAAARGLDAAARRSIPVVVLLVLLTFGLAIHAPSAHGQGVSPELEALVRASDSSTILPVIIRLRDRLDAREIARDSRRTGEALRARRSRLLRALKAQSGRRANRELRRRLRTGGGRRIRDLWLINAVAAEVPAAMVDELSQLPEVESVEYDATLQQPPENFAVAMSGPERWNLVAVGAPELWQRGFSGQGVVVATLDSGVDPLHPDLGPAWRGGTNSWFDPHAENPAPHDVTGHGTQVLGLILGGDGSGSTIGMAPGASWIAAKIFDNSGTATVSAIHASLQWVIDPDSDSETDDAPDIVNNSWGLVNSVNDCDVAFEADLAALRAAEIVVVFSAGNSGPNSSTSMSPANNPPVHFATGSVDPSLVIESSSARGPSACTGSFFPAVVAPGFSVVTTGLTVGGLFPETYESVYGTSFAAPHVAGAFALLKSAFPTATLDELEAAIASTTVDLGSPGPDDTYGAGLIDVEAAYLSLVPGSGTSVPALSAPGVALIIGLLIGVSAVARRRSTNIERPPE
jgi:serine protease AprX